MSDIERIATSDTSDLEKIKLDAEDFEGHKLGESKVEPKVEPDFEGHRWELKVESKVVDRPRDV